MIAKGKSMLLTIVLLLGAASVYTQAENVPFIKVSIPFDFTVGDQPPPAGDYTISDSAVHTQSAIWLQSVDGKHVAAVLTHPRYELKAPARTRLIFQHAGGEYFLSQLWTRGSFSGREVQPKKKSQPIGTRTAHSQ